MGKKIALVFSEDYLGSYPSFVESIKILSQHKHRIDIIGTTRDTKFPNPPIFNSYVKFLNIPIDHIIERDYDRVCDKSVNTEPSHTSASYIDVIKYFLPLCIKRYIRDIINYIKHNIQNFRTQKIQFITHFKYTVHVIHKLAIGRYDFVIYVDLYGGASTYLCSLIFNINNKIYWGLEITTKHQSLAVNQILKFLESKSCNHSDIIFTTDVSRGKDVCIENNTEYIKKNFIYLPHSPSGFCKHNKSIYFQKMFSLNPKDEIILHSGWIHEVMRSRELAEESCKWPTNWKLVFHERMHRSRKEQYIKKVNRAGKGKVLLSLNPVPYDFIDDIILSAKIGIVIYDTAVNWGTSWSSLVKGSGKIAHYLRCGRPVICSNLPGFDEIVNKYECGFLFDDISEIPHYISIILRNYSFFSNNALKCYKDEYEFSKHFNKFLQYIEHFS